MFAIALVTIIIRVAKSYFQVFEFGLLHFLALETANLFRRAFGALFSPFYDGPRNQKAKYESAGNHLFSDFIEFVFL